MVGCSKAEIPGGNSRWSEAAHLTVAGKQGTQEEGLRVTHPESDTQPSEPPPARFSLLPVHFDTGISGSIH